LLFTFFSKFGPRDEAEWALDSIAGDRPLGTLRNRSVIARCLGLIDEDMLRLIDELRSLRNKRAHSSEGFALTVDDMQRPWQALPNYAKEGLKQFTDGWSQAYGTAFGQYITCASWAADAVGENAAVADAMLEGIRIAELAKRERERDDLSIEGELGP